MISIPRRTCSAILAALISAVTCSMAYGIEEPEYEVLTRIDGIDVRRYAASIQAVTAMPESGGSNGGFRRLAGYIFGGNSDNQKISMTAPVATTITAAGAEMAFTMPASWSMAALPTPEDENVGLREVPAYVAAVLTFSGRATEARSQTVLSRLQQQLAALKIETAGPPILNQYNPPWTLPFLRRNEVMIKIIWPATQSIAGQ